MRSLLSQVLFGRPAKKLTSTWRPPHVSLVSSLLTRLFPSSVNNAVSTRMDIRKDQFSHEAVRLLEDIADSHFISFDFEFSGIKERRDRAGKPTLEQHYAETRLAVHDYQPLQIGLTLVKLDEEKGQCHGLIQIQKFFPYLALWDVAMIFSICYVVILFSSAS